MNALAVLLKSLKKYVVVETVVQFGSLLEQKKFNDIDLCIFYNQRSFFETKIEDST